MALTSVKVRRHIRVLLLVSTVHFLVVLPVVSYFLPFPLYSTYSRVITNTTDALNRAKAMNRLRVEEAKEYFRKSNATMSQKYYTDLKESGDIHVAVAIVTVNRSRRNTELKENLGYLAQSSVAIDRFAKSEEFRNKTFVFVCNVDSKPYDHKGAQFLQRYLPFTSRYGSSNFHSRTPLLPGSKYSYRRIKHETSYDKETYDYMYCLHVAHSLHPSYILMVEDDAIAHRQLPKVLRYTLEKHLKSKERFAYLKLYYPIKWQGYSFEALSLLELVSLGLAGGGITSSLLCGCLCIARDRTLTSQSKFWPFLISFLMVMLSAELLGRQNVLEMRRASPQLYQLRPSPGCCTPAMLYPQEVVPSLLKHLHSVPTNTHTDLAIYDFVKSTNIAAYMLEPNLFYHVGMFTSLKLGHKSPEEFVFTI